MSIADMFWGDRYGQIQDPFGHRWAIATHKKMCLLRKWKKQQKNFLHNKESVKKFSNKF